VDLFDGILKAGCYRSRRNDTSCNSSLCVFTSLGKKNHVEEDTFVDFSRSSYTVFDQASFKRLEGAKSDLQPKMLTWLLTDGLYGVRGGEKLWVENGLAQVRTMVTCVIE
jgi:hypothetical protein